MAQAVFDEHPLEEYLREFGEMPELMPGGAHEFSAEHVEHHAFPHAISVLNWLLPFASSCTDLARKYFSTGKLTLAQNASEFAERFKYDVISSTLLETSISATPNTPRRNTQSTSPSPSLPDIPGALSRPLPHQVIAFYHPQWPASVACLAALIGLQGFYMLAAMLLLCAWYYVYIVKTEPVPSYDTASFTLDALAYLVDTGRTWDSVVNEAIDNLECVDRGAFHSPILPPSPISALRISLLSTLQTTQTQCDNVRTLLSALTSPSELSLLSEMYAPTSPSLKQSFSHHDLPWNHHSDARPLSLPDRKQLALSSNGEKRSTWSGAHFNALTSGTSPPPSHVKLRDKRRSDFFALSQLTPSTTKASISAPVTPHVGLPGGEENANDTLSKQEEYFGAEALDLHRKRKRAGIDTLGLSSRPRSPYSFGSSPRMSTFQPSSRFTTMHTTSSGSSRHPHPLSFSSLQLALQNAIAAKRYACAHLLALRFEDDDDNAYWENVRSVMALLSTTFEDASSRLSQALDAVEKERQRDEIPSVASGSREGSVSPDPFVSVKVSVPQRPPSSRVVSFAPVPSHLTRFAAHVDAISTALSDARQHLDHCVTALRDENSINPSRFAQDAPAFQAYDRLRRELGLALRECERGKGTLVDILSPEKILEDDFDADDMPTLAHDAGSSGDSDKQDQFPTPKDGSPILDHRASIVSPPIAISENDEAMDVDDATSHLLMMSSSQHLPPQGIEQVFESESGSGAAFTRERSKLSREERIKLAKARRESSEASFGVASIAAEPASGGRETWGPGGEVVQELKDVIWKVSERRRKITEGVLHDESRTLLKGDISPDTPHPGKIPS